VTSLGIPAGEVHDDQLAVLGVSLVCSLGFLRFRSCIVVLVLRLQTGFLTLYLCTDDAAVYFFGRCCAIFTLASEHDSWASSFCGQLVFSAHKCYYNKQVQSVFYGIHLHCIWYDTRVTCAPNGFGKPG
jgi:hypothetical protein